jgi:circadian clock protein KaiC
MKDTEAIPPPLTRIATGVPGLDEVTGGGLLRSGVYILQGAPGAGKTIMANQIVHGHAAAGGQVVYVTMLAESHARLLQHMEGFTFFDPSALPQKVYYVSAFDALRSAGLKGVVELLRTEMRSRGAGIVVLDGLVAADSTAASDEDLKLFISDIQAHSTLAGCTTLLLASEHADRPVRAEHTMVDGILLLRERAYGPRRERSLEVVKFRGSGTLRGNHAFQIGEGGITVYPRLEAVSSPDIGDAVGSGSLSTGVATLDAMFDIGGYAQGSVTALSGPSGSGKTTLALHYAAAASEQEKALFCGFYESPQLLLRAADVLGIGLRRQADAGHVRFVSWRFGENLLDALATQVLTEVNRTGARRVVIDGVGGFIAAPAYRERGGAFVAALLNELRRLGATTLVTIEEGDASGERAVDTPTLSSISDNLLCLDLRREFAVRRFASIRKTRVSRCDLRVREMVLRDAGLELVEPDAAASLSAG